MKWLVNSWYQSHPVRWLLWPFSILYRLIISIRRQCYRIGLFKQHRLNVPVIIVGNITAGGTGKTPFVIWLSTELKKAGYLPGIVSRGYGGKAENYPQLVDATSHPATVGDEPLLIFRHTQCPMAVAPDRVDAANLLIEKHGCNLIISDDGLQHYALGRDIEIVIIDGQRQFGNQLCLPAGPLREPMTRLKQLEFMVYNSPQHDHEFSMFLEQTSAINLAQNNISCSIKDFMGQSVHAVAGIGNPNRFFDQLRTQGIHVIEHAFNDHHPYSHTDLNFGDNLPILMTEKDAVKCTNFASSTMWFIPIEATIQGKLLQQLLTQLNLLEHTYHG